MRLKEKIIGVQKEISKIFKYVGYLGPLP